MLANIQLDLLQIDYDCLQSETMMTMMMMMIQHDLIVELVMLRLD